MAAQSRPCVVYWLFDDTCVCPWRHGYVGISERLNRRIIRHHHERKRPFAWKILFRGTRDECLAIEEKMRPTWGVGWNQFQGGRGGATGPKSPEHRAKMRAAALRRYASEAERARTAIAVQAAFKSIDRYGTNNGRFGKPVSQETRRKISEARKGRALGNQNWRKRKPFSETVLRKISEASKRRWATRKSLKGE